MSSTLTWPVQRFPDSVFKSSWRLNCDVSAPDGSRDFDPLVGSWSVHVRRLLSPLTGSDEWVELEGTSNCRNIWEGHAQLEELTLVDSADGTRNWALALRLYHPPTRMWNLYWANSNSSTIGAPETGRFVNGRGEFFARELFKGTNVLVRYLWTDLATTKPKFEQAFSTDEGLTWEPNWVALRARP